MKQRGSPCWACNNLDAYWESKSTSTAPLDGRLAGDDDRSNPEGDGAPEVPTSEVPLEKPSHPEDRPGRDPAAAEG